ncbi:MAG TPA: hypothetical protein VGH04_15885 [Gemmatimonadaceae bacterium]
MSAGARNRASALARFAFASLAIWAALALSTAAVAAQTVLTCNVSGPSGKCAPTVTLDQPATMVNPALLQLTVSPTASTYTAVTTDMDQAAGLATFTPISLTVQANRAWTIQVNASAAFWSASGGAWTSKPVSDLIWSLAPAGATTTMSTTAKTLTTGSAGPGSPSVSVYMRPIAHWATDKPGNYSMTVTFTMTTP